MRAGSNDRPLDFSEIDRRKKDEARAEKLRRIGVLSDDGPAKPDEWNRVVRAGRFVLLAAIWIALIGNVAALQNASMSYTIVEIGPERSMINVLVYGFNSIVCVGLLMLFKRKDINRLASGD